MTSAEFAGLARDPGWKYEYAHGSALISPRHLVVQMRVPVTPRVVESAGILIRPVSPEDASGLVRAFFNGFRDTVEYCDCSATHIRHSGEDAIATFFGGKRGAFHEASRLAVVADDTMTIVGAALVVQKKQGPFLDMLFIDPLRHRRGLATALVGSVMNALHTVGEPHLGSAYNLANAPSRAWHEAFGFVERPDSILALVRAERARHELRRLQGIGRITPGKREALVAEAEHWERLAASLEAETLHASHF